MGLRWDQGSNTAGESRCYAAGVARMQHWKQEEAAAGSQDVLIDGAGLAPLRPEGGKA